MRRQRGLAPVAHHWLSEGPQARHIIFLCLSFLICEMGVIFQALATSWDTVKLRSDHGFCHIQMQGCVSAYMEKVGCIGYPLSTPSGAGFVHPLILCTECRLRLRHLAEDRRDQDRQSLPPPGVQSQGGGAHKCLQD